MSRHLICLIDGTMVSAAHTDAYASYSNIFELACLLQLYNRAADGEPQVVFYSSGISSQPDTRSLFNLATGNSILSQIVDQYTNICANYDFDRPGDKIYLFGFSRGAMAVRALAGLISEFGLLKPQDIRHLPVVLDAWSRSWGKGSLPDHIDLLSVDIEFIGIFDAVMGGFEALPVFNPIRFSNHYLPARCRGGIHLLAIDEDRPHFREKPWQGVAPRSATRYFRQIWMPGVHSDVGGTGHPVWGRASLLAMVHYVGLATQLSLDSNWVRQKEIRFKQNVQAGIYRIPGNHARIRMTRRPQRNQDMRQFYHPICHLVRKCEYKRKKDLDWYKARFQPVFKGAMKVDWILARYFRSI